MNIDLPTNQNSELQALFTIVPHVCNFFCVFATTNRSKTPCANSRWSCA